MLRFIVLLAVFLVSAMSAFANDRQSAYDRVMKTGVLRCAYLVYPPETIKDPNTGALSGTVVETVEALGKALDVTVDWVEEVAFTNMFEGLKTGRHDALCAGLYENPARAKSALFSIPTSYGVTYAFSRQNDQRFDQDLSLIDDESVTIATIDGEVAQSIANQKFPKAQQLALPQLSDISMVLENVASGKADIAFLQKAPAKNFIDNNPGKIKVVGDEPVKAYPAPPLVVNVNEVRLKYLFDSALRSLILDGDIEKILRKYDPDLGSHLLVAKPYRK